MDDEDDNDITPEQIAGRCVIASESARYLLQIVKDIALKKTDGMPPDDYAKYGVIGLADYLKQVIKERTLDVPLPPDYDDLLRKWKDSHR